MKFNIVRDKDKKIRIRILDDRVDTLLGDVVYLSKPFDTVTEITDEDIDETMKKAEKYIQDCIIEKQYE